MDKLNAEGKKYRADTQRVLLRHQIRTARGLAYRLSTHPLYGMVIYRVIGNDNNRGLVIHGGN